MNEKYGRNERRKRYKKLRKWIVHKAEASLEHRKNTGTIFSAIQIIDRYYLMMTTGDAEHSITVILKQPNFQSKDDAFERLLILAENDELSVNLFIDRKN